MKEFGHFLYSRRIPIENKRFRSQDLLDLVSLLDQEFDGHPCLVKRITFVFQNGSCDTFTDSSWFPSFSRKPVRQIDLCYKDDSSSREILLFLCQELESGSSCLILSSNQSEWRDAMTFRISEYLDSVEHQISFSRFLSHPYSLFLSAFLGILSAFFTQCFLFLSHCAPQIPLFFLMTVILSFFWYPILHQIKKGFPSIEFLFHHSEKRRGVRYRNFFVWILSSLIPSLFFFLLGQFLK